MPETAREFLSRVMSDQWETRDELSTEVLTEPDDTVEAAPTESPQDEADDGDSDVPANATATEFPELDSPAVPDRQEIPGEPPPEFPELERDPDPEVASAPEPAPRRMGTQEQDDDSAGGQVVNNYNISFPEGLSEDLADSMAPRFAEMQTKLLGEFHDQLDHKLAMLDRRADY